MTRYIKEPLRKIIEMSAPIYWHQVEWNWPGIRGAGGVWLTSSRRETKETSRMERGEPLGIAGGGRSMRNRGGRAGQPRGRCQIERGRETKTAVLPLVKTRIRTDSEAEQTTKLII